MSIRYINSNDLINDVPAYLQNIINNMDCVYIDGIKPNNQHFNLVEHDKKIKSKAIDDMENSLIRNSRTEYIDGEIHLIVTEDRIKLIAEQLKEQNK